MNDDNNLRKDVEIRSMFGAKGKLPKGIQEKLDQRKSNNNEESKKD
ncbi:hypothetical protein LCR01_14230 [Companilactobacillus crustorum]|uniref:Uncharacterized protein n=1 Tax=Companilactobacillus crustorum TaxID=392416 RepID=A0AB34AC62_9LACO|nr:hypothetical protein [Companilactobacillus crustorum]APU71690.1 hypothetical protein BI355_1372 [Companilactobacillus crustorum]WDT66292.1 hypothetical protein NV391_03570 [Companilactobacillus crustorum]GEO76980.1 hypothetical protein LCR01_14230 [Companilactobacillus crustorum]